MRTIDLWTHELRRTGVAALAVPPAVALLLAALQLGAGSSTSTLWAWVVASALPPVAGLSAAAMLGRERMRELHATLAVRRSACLLRRAALVGVASAGGTVIVAAGLIGSGVADPVSRAAVIVASCVALVGVAVATVASTGAPAAAASAVLGAWLVQLLVVDRALGGGTEAVALAIVGALLLRGAAPGLDDGERLVRHAGRDA